MEALVILLAWIAFSYLLAAVLPPIGRGTGYLFLFIGEVIILSLSLLGKILWVHSRRLVHMIGKAILFAGLLIQECWRGPQEQEEEFRDEGLEDEQEQIDPYESALEILGLSPGFSRAAFSSAYKIAMRKAHPDTGGSTKAAQLVNKARAIIMRRHGWT